LTTPRVGPVDFILKYRLLLLLLLLLLIKFGRSERRDDATVERVIRLMDAHAVFRTDLRNLPVGRTAGKYLSALMTMPASGGIIAHDGSLASPRGTYRHSCICILGVSLYLQGLLS